MRALISSNPPWCKTGYGVQARMLAEKLRELGHDVAMMAVPGPTGGAVTWNGIRVYPGGRHPAGLDIIEAHAAHFRADFMICLHDAWAIDPTLLDRSSRLIPWFPVDTEPIAPGVVAAVAAAWQGVVYSKFGERVARDAGLDVRYVPHAVDTKLFRPMDRTQARIVLGLPHDRFIVGMVAMNSSYPSRKALPECLQAFAQFRRAHCSDALLYLHTLTARPGNGAQVDLERIASLLDIRHSMRLADEYVVTGGASDEHMVALYNAFDVLLSPSLAEGFGVPILEAQSCGCPVIVGDWTAMTELCFEGLRISRMDAHRTWDLLGGWRFTPHVGAIVEALRHVFSAGSRGPAVIERARAGALSYDVDRVTDLHLRPLMDELASRLGDESTERGL